MKTFTEFAPQNNDPPTFKRVKSEALTFILGDWQLPTSFAGVQKWTNLFLLTLR